LIRIKELLLGGIATVFIASARIKTCFAEQFWRIADIQQFFASLKKTSISGSPTVMFHVRVVA